MQESDTIRRMTIEWTRAQPSVSRFIRSFVRDRAQAEDLLQEVALVIVDRFETYQPERPFIGWALGIARRVVLTHLRATYRDRRVEYSDAVDRVADSFERLEPQAEAMKDSLAQCIGNVHGRSHQALLLRYTEGLELRQIAERLGMTANNVGVLLHRVRTSLRECVERKLRQEGHS
jgi:RNA polymerase sigma-70 factor (ECF subfamily)